MGETLDVMRRDDLRLCCKDLMDLGAEFLSRVPPPKGIERISKARENLVGAFAVTDAEDEAVYTSPIKAFCVAALKSCHETEDVKRFEEIFKARELQDLIEGINEALGADEIPPAKPADGFDEKPMRFVWYPFIPCGEYSVMAAAGGTGKGMAACLISAYLSAGNDLPEDKPCPDYLRAFPYREPQNVLFVSSEDTGGEIKSRLRVSHADLSRVYILDKDSSSGLDLSTGKGLERLRKYIEERSARLVVLDPVQAFIGGETDMNRGAKMRSILSGFSRLAGETDCGILLIAHTNKKAQETDLNGGILGSVETVNASRSVMQIMRDPEEDDPRTNLRIILHTKSNHARLGRTVRFEIGETVRNVDGVPVYEAGGHFVSDNLYSDVSKELFEEAVRRRVSARELLTMKRYEETQFNDLMDALRELADKLRGEGKKTALFAYSELDGSLWGGKRPFDALQIVSFKLVGEGIFVRGNQQVRTEESGKSGKAKGFRLTLSL